MSVKIAIAVHLSEHKECTACHCFTDTGYILKDDLMSRFVCEDCYAGISSEYPLASKLVEIDRQALNSLIPEGKNPGFHAGYLMGKKENTASGYKIYVSRFLDSVQGDRGTVTLFGSDDVPRIRKISREEDLTLVGIYRTNPSGSPDFNSLDNNTLDDMLLDIIYMVIGGCTDMQIAVKDKSDASDEVGVIIS